MVDSASKKYRKSRLIPALLLFWDIYIFGFNRLPAAGFLIGPFEGIVDGAAADGDGGNELAVF